MSKLFKYMKFFLYTFTWKPTQGNLVRSFCEEFKINESEIDPHFGVIDLDPEKDLYCTMITKEAAERIGVKLDVKGPFSNTRIGPFGPE